MKNDVTIYPLGIFDAFQGLLKNEGLNFHDALKIDLKEDEKQFVLHADAPGVNKEDIHVNFDKGLLTIDIEERKSSEVKEGERYIRTERHYSKKSRSLPFGNRVDETNIEAEFKDGVLTLILPKKEEEKVTRKIEVK